MNNIKFIAEIASTHQGKIIRLNKILNQIVNSNTDFIKLQIYKNSALNHKSSRFFSNLKKYEINFKNWNNLIIKFYKKKKIILEPFDEVSYDFCKKFKSKIYVKISSSEIDNINLILDACKNFKKVFLNISGCNSTHLFKLEKILKNHRKKVVILYGFQAFPSKIKDIRFNIIKYFFKKKYCVGYSDHSDTTSNAESYIATLLAIENGSQYIEKHVTLDRNKFPPDFSSSLEIEDFKEYVNFFKNKFKINKTFKQSKDEMKYGQEMHKFAVLKKKVKKGNYIKLNDFVFLRTNKNGIGRGKISKYIKKKKKYKKNYSKNEIM